MLKSSLFLLTLALLPSCKFSPKEDTVLAEDKTIKLTVSIGHQNKKMPDSQDEKILYSGTLKACKTNALTRFDETNNSMRLIHGDEHCKITLQRLVLKDDSLTFPESDSIWEKDSHFTVITDKKNELIFHVEKNLDDKLTGDQSFVLSYRPSNNSEVASTKQENTDEVSSLLSYSNPFAVYTIGQEIVPNTPSIAGLSFTAYSIEPQLPMGLEINKATGVISGRPLAAIPKSQYQVTASRAGISSASSLDITVVSLPSAPAAPVANRLSVSNLSENTFSWIDTKSSSGGAEIVVYYLQIASTDQRPSVFGDPILVFSGLVKGLSKTFLGITNKSYYARVRAIDSLGNSSDYSPVSERLTLDTEGPSTPDFFFISQELDFLKIQWQASQDNVSSAENISYHACIGTDVASLADCEMKLSNGDKNFELAKNFILVPMADYIGGTFYVRIVVMDEAGNQSLSRITPLQYNAPYLSNND